MSKIFNIGGNIVKEIKDEEILDRLYEIQEFKLDKIILSKEKEIESSLNDVSDLIVDIKDSRVQELLDKLEDNCSIKLSYISKEFYKQGIKDGIKFILSCM